MPSAVQLADQLSQLTLSELTDLLESRPLGLGRQQDLHDVADALLTPESLAAALRILSRESLAAIRDGRRDIDAVQLLVSSPDGEPYPEAVAQLPAIDPAAVPDEPAASPTLSSAVLHTIVAIRDVIERCAMEPIPLSATGGLLKVDEKALAHEFVLPDHEIAVAIWMAVRAGVVRNVDRRLRVTDRGLDLRDSLGALWQAVVDGVLATIPLSVMRSMRHAVRLDRPFVEWAWPLRSSADQSLLESVHTAVDMLGLVVGGTTELGRACLADDRNRVEELVSSALPPLEHTVYVLDDLSVISPGPIDSQTAAVLDTMCTIETRGVAAKRRIDGPRILRAVTPTRSVDDVIDSLAAVSVTPLTAAVTSTIRDIATNTRFVALNGTGTDTAARASHRELGALLLTDPRLQRLAPVKVDDVTVLYGASRERVETALIEGRYTVVSAARAVPIADPAPTSAMAELAVQLHEVGLGTTHLERALVIAGKSKSRVTLVVDTSDGLRTMTIEPRHVANGRVRGVDTGSDVERTVPISAIVELKAVGE